MSPLSQRLQLYAAHLADRLSDAAFTPDPMLLEAIAADCEGVARSLRRLAAEQRREGDEA